MPEPAQVDDNHRNAHRIEEDVLLACRVLPEGSDGGGAAGQFFETPALAELTVRLSHLDQQFRECQARLARVDSVAAEALQLLDAKLTAMKDVVVQSESERAGGPALVRVKASLGATGIGFPSPLPLEAGALVALNLLLLPERESITARARIRQVRPIGSGGCWAGAEFLGLADDDQRRLTRHVLKAEISRRK